MSCGDKAIVSKVKEESRASDGEDRCYVIVWFLPPCYMPYRVGSFTFVYSWDWGR